MAFAKVWLQAQRFDRFRMCFLFVCFGRLKPVISLACHGGESRMGKRKVWVERDCLFVKMRGGPEILQEVIGPRLVFAASEIENISVRIIRRFCFDARFLLWRKCRTESVGNLLRHFSFHSKDVDQLPIVTLRPKMRVG